ncbi:MAG: YceI family protein [Chitinophagaceae bacterium]|nr:YceI family protein [Chitinophagaceae bacterium]
MSTKSTWVIDPSHSEILFRVKHLMITNVKGEFRKFDGKIINTGDNFHNAHVELQIDAASIFTNNSDRDAHLSSADFFDVANHPQITFRGTALTQLDEDNYQLKGMLGMKGVEKEVVLDVEFGGLMKDPYGNEKAGFSVSGKFNRKDWGLNWNAALETGGVMVSEEVRVNGEVQFVKQVAEMAMA